MPTIEHEQKFYNIRACTARNPAFKVNQSHTTFILVLNFLFCISFHVHIAPTVTIEFRLLTPRCRLMNLSYPPPPTTEIWLCILLHIYIHLIYCVFACQGVKLLDRLPYMPVWLCSCLNNFQYLEMLLKGIQKYVINGLNDFNN